MKKKEKALIVAILIVMQLAGIERIEAQTWSLETLPAGLSKYIQEEIEDTLQGIKKNEKNYWLPGIEVVGLNLGIWAFNRYITTEGWSAISWESIKNNFKNGFEWDADGYLMNQFWHPYHGANYYSIARANGLEFWESAPYAFGGSLMWEYFMEIEPPSYNDIVNTPVTGILLGEISFRVSELIVDESTTGFERFIREFSATLINPMNGIHRLLRGDMWKVGLGSEKSQYNLTISSGIHNVFLSKNINNSKTYMTIRGDLEYGNQLDIRNHKKPFDYFKVHSEVNFIKGDNIVGIFASGVLTDNKLDLFDGTRNIIGIYKEVDIHINTVYKLSATSVTGQIINTVPLTGGIMMQNYLGISAILMGGTNSQYAKEYGKDYNLGPGASGKIGIKISFKDNADIYANYKRYWIHTLSGADSEEFVGLLNAGTSYRIFSKTSLGLDFLLYERYGEYDNFPDTRDSNSAIRFYIKQSI